MKLSVITLGDHMDGRCPDAHRSLWIAQRCRDALGGRDALLLKFDGGGLPMEKVRRSMALFAERVAPALRD